LEDVNSGKNSNKSPRFRKSGFFLKKTPKIFGEKENVRIFAARLRNNGNKI